MPQLQLIIATVALYHKHGWHLRRALLTPATHQTALQTNDATLAQVLVTEHEIDALWFARPSHENREAWELRWVNATPYALFETFEPDEAEEDREDVRRDLEARLREYARGAIRLESGL